MLKKLLYENTFNQIFTQHYTRLYLYAYHLTNDAEASRDIVSDVFAKLWEDIKHIKQENVSGYLTTTVRNRCIDHFRHHQGIFCRSRYILYRLYRSYEARHPDK